MHGQGLRRQSMQGSKWLKKVCWGTVSPKTFIFISPQKDLFEAMGSKFFHEHSNTTKSVMKVASKMKLFRKEFHLRSYLHYNFKGMKNKVVKKAFPTESLEHWITKPGVPCSKLQGNTMVDSAFHLFCYVN